MLNSSVVDSLNLEDMPTLVDLITHFGYSAEVTEDESPNRLSVVALESSVEPIVYVLDWNPTVDDVCPVGSLRDGWLLGSCVNVDIVRILPEGQTRQFRSSGPATTLESITKESPFGNLLKPSPIDGGYRQARF